MKFQSVVVLFAFFYPGSDAAMGGLRSSYPRNLQEQKQKHTITVRYGNSFDFRCLDGYPYGVGNKCTYQDEWKIKYGETDGGGSLVDCQNPNGCQVTCDLSCSAGTAASSESTPGGDQGVTGAQQTSGADAGFKGGEVYSVMTGQSAEFRCLNDLLIGTNNNCQFTETDWESTSSGVEASGTTFGKFLVCKNENGCNLDCTPGKCLPRKMAKEDFPVGQGADGQGVGGATQGDSTKEGTGRNPAKVTVTVTRGPGSTAGGTASGASTGTSGGPVTGAGTGGVIGASGPTNRPPLPSKGTAPARKSRKGNTASGASVSGGAVTGATNTGGVIGTAPASKGGKSKKNP